jgi:hypothetical protein
MIDINNLVIDWNNGKMVNLIPVNGNRFSTKETDYLIGEQTGLCINCQKPTHFVDIYSEARICCEKCEKEFYKKLHEWEIAAAEHFEEDL